MALDPYPQNRQYEALAFSIDGQQILYRKGHVTPDRPGHFLTIWKRSDGEGPDSKKTRPFGKPDLDYLFVEVHDHQTSKQGMFIFPLTVLLKKGVVRSEKAKGKMALRVFPPWTSSRGEVKSQVFSESAKRTQRWQCEYFVWMENNVITDVEKFARLFGAPVS
ncbi:MepB family protein [Vibrio coralliilyticus]|nr:MepB family protein [Vibrio coralliilyticus]NRF53343.1 MepB family protein [Vibrio coralliilyticus]